MVPMRRFYIACCFIGLLAPAWSQNTPPKCRRLPASLKEVSGSASTENGLIWMHNDSRNPPVLVLYNPVLGKIVDEKKLPVLNRDWEDLAADQKGNLYIGDFGNNQNRRKDLRIYRYNPRSGRLDSILFHYPDQYQFPPAEKDWNFNAEAMVFFQDSLHLFSKNVFTGNFVVKHYILPAEPGIYEAMLVDSIRLKNRVVTGAALSRDGDVLALTSYYIGKKFGWLPFTKCTVFTWRNFKGSRFFSGQMRRKRLPKFLIARQYESIIHWQNNTWLVTNEARPPQKQAIRRIKI